MKKIGKKERLRKQKESNKLIKFSQMPYKEQLNDIELLAEI